MPSYHERVARIMKATHSAGLLSSYDEILAAIRRKFPQTDEGEAALRAHLAEIEHKLRAVLPPYTHSTLQTEGEYDCSHCHRTVLLDGEGEPRCPDPRCRATVKP